MYIQVDLRTSFVFGKKTSINHDKRRCLPLPVAAVRSHPQPSAATINIQNKLRIINERPIFIPLCVENGRKQAVRAGGGGAGGSSLIV